jgi:hypothetical protein
MAKRKDAPASASTAPFPAELELQRKDLVRAGQDVQDPSIWPEGAKLERAYGPETIAGILIKAFHRGIRNRPIAYLWKENMGAGTRVKLGQAAKASPQLRLLGEVDFVLTFNWEAWKILTPEQRVALVDHELQHCDVDADSNEPILVEHDVEEFSLIVRRYGLWKPTLRTFGDAVAAVQGDLWQQEPAPPRASAVTPLAISK